MKKLAAAIALSTVASFATADDNLSFNASVLTDYTFRGISQTDEDAAFQAGADYAFDSGFYLGVWGSNVDFGDGDDADAEIDIYAGYSGNITEEVSYDISYIAYTYANESSYNYEEYALSLGYADFTFGYNYSDTYWGGDDLSAPSFSYYSLGYSFDLADDYNVALSVGLNEFSNDNWLSDGADSYTDWSVAVSKSFGGFDFTLSYVDTDLSKDEAWDTDWAESRAVFSVGKTF
jgi:uncharacterized protein (TIGR02001 family)